MDCQNVSDWKIDRFMYFIDLKWINQTIEKLHLSFREKKLYINYIVVTKTVKPIYMEPKHEIVFYVRFIF